MDKRHCACQCGGTLRNKGRFLPGHNQFNARLWHGKDHKLSAKNTTTTIYRNDAGVAAPEPIVNQEPAWVPSPTEFYIATFQKKILGGVLFRLSNGDLVYAHRTVLPYGWSGSAASVRIERSDRGVRWRALEVQPYIGEEL